MKHTSYLFLSFCILAIWTSSSSRAQNDAKRPGIQVATAQCPENRPIYFDGECRGKRFFERFAVSGFDILQVSGCTDRPIDNTGACGLSFAITESNGRGNIRTITVTNIKREVARRSVPSTAQLSNAGVRNGYRIITRLATKQEVFPSGNRRVTVTLTEFSRQGEKRDAYRQRMTFTDLESTPGTFTYQAAMEICTNVPLADLFQEDEEQSLACNTRSCQYTSHRSEYKERLDGSLITDINVSMPRNIRKTPVRLTSSEDTQDYDECISGLGTYAGGLLQTYNNDTQTAASCGPEIDALELLPEQICDGISGADGFIIGFVTSPFLSMEWTVGFPSGIEFQGVSGQPLSFGNILWTAAEDGISGAEFTSEYNMCGLVFGSDRVGVEFNDFFCGLDQFAGTCNGTHRGVPVVVGADDDSGLQCNATADLECTSSRDGAKLGDPDCQCEATSITVDPESCRANN